MMIQIVDEETIYDKVDAKFINNIYWISELNDSEDSEYLKGRYWIPNPEESKEEIAQNVDYQQTKKNQKVTKKIFMLD